MLTKKYIEHDDEVTAPEAASFVAPSYILHYTAKLYSLK